MLRKRHALFQIKLSHACFKYITDLYNKRNNTFLNARRPGKLFLGARQSNRCSVFSIEWSTKYKFVLVECEIKVEKLVRLFKVSLHSSFQMWTSALLEYMTVMFMLIALIPMVLSNAFVNMDTKEKERAAKV